MLKTFLAILLGKSIFFISRLFNLGGGFAAPGLYALKIDPGLVGKLINHKAQNILITGTNGKTTTSKIISDILKTAGYKVLRNSSGSNLERGIASYLIKHSGFWGNIDYDFGVWEADEFAFNTLAPQIKPEAIIFLNAFRDQLDRYGEVDKVIKKWETVLGNLQSKSILIANSDDGSLEKIVRGFKGKTITFGVKDSNIKGESKVKSDKKPNYEAQILNTDDLANTEFSVNFEGNTETFRIPLPGIFNVYNFLASYSLIRELNLDTRVIDHSLKNFEPAFGRFERFEIKSGEKSKNVNIFLIKNPVGATQVLETINPHISASDSLILALNDNFADGTDVSWIWDVNFEILRDLPREVSLFVSGFRALDLGLRLKYAGIDESNLRIEPNLERAFEEGLKRTGNKLFILPTYTAMLEIQKILVKKGIKKEYWRE